MLGSASMESTSAGGGLKEAFTMLGARSMSEARSIARLEILSARECVCCRWFLLRASRATATTSPRALVEQLDPWERDEHSLRVAAAWILLHGG
jgi:hypothetical protein